MQRTVSVPSESRSGYNAKHFIIQEGLRFGIGSEKTA